MKIWNKRDLKVTCWRINMIDFILNNEDRKDIESWIKELEQDKELKIGNYLESGGLGVRVEDIIDKNVTFEIYRTIGLIQRRIK